MQTKLNTKDIIKNFDKSKLDKVDIRELIDRAGIELQKKTLPQYEEIKNYFWDEDYTAEDFYNDYGDKVGSTCYILFDTVTNRVRRIYPCEVFTHDKYLDLLDSISTFTDDLLFEDMLKYIFGDFYYGEGILESTPENNEWCNYLRSYGHYDDLFAFIVDKKLDVGSDLTYLYMFATGDTSLGIDITD